MEALSLPIYNTEGKEVDSIKLDAAVFDGKINSACLHQVITAYRANQRKGLASTKTRGEVSGGGRKPWKQKGTGRARVGSIRSPLWRHGGVIFGPHPREFYYNVPQKMKRLALRSALCAKAKENNLIVLDSFRIQSAKTKEAAKVFSNLNINSARAKRPVNTLLLLDKMDNNLILALRNIDFLNVNLTKYTHAYEVLASKKLVLTKRGLEELTKRLKTHRHIGSLAAQDKVSGE